MTDEEQKPRRWARLNGEWHGSVATRTSALHVMHEGGGSVCNPRRTMLDDCPFSIMNDEEAREDGKRCQRCLKKTGGDP